MNTSIRFMATVVLFFALLGIVFDYSQINYIKRSMKDALDLSTKAAALQLDEDPVKLAQGKFDIDVQKAKAVNEDIFINNLDERFNGSIVATDIINAHSKTNYTAPSGRIYEINAPTIFSSVKYKYDGIFVEWDINVDILSGSVLKNKNEILNR